MRTLDTSTQSEKSQSAASRIKNEVKSPFFAASSEPATPFFGLNTIQPNLEIGQADDKYEQQADRVADAVVNSPTPGLQMQPLEEEKEMLQLKPAFRQSLGIQRQESSETELMEQDPSGDEGRVIFENLLVTMRAMSEAISMTLDRPRKILTSEGRHIWNPSKSAKLSNRLFRMNMHVTDKLSHMVAEVSNRIHATIERKPRLNRQVFGLLGLRNIAENLARIGHGLSWGMSIYRVREAPPEDRSRVVAEEAGGQVGSSIGFATGVRTGFALGSRTRNPWFALGGAIGGGIGGLLSGTRAGEAIGRAAHGSIEKGSTWKQRKVENAKRRFNRYWNRLERVAKDPYSLIEPRP